MKHFWRTFLLILGSLFILDAIIVGFTITINFGIIAISLIGALYFLAGLFHDHVYSRKRKTTRIWIGATLLLIHTLLLAFFAFIAYFGRSDTIARDADAVIVLGTALNGEQVSPSLQSRLDATIEYVSENPAAKIVVTGGKGYGEDITQALAMQRYLISYGIPDSSILLEEKSSSTVENFKFTREILDDYFTGEYSTAFITNDYHVFRASLSSAAAGIPSSHGYASTPWYQVPVDYAREFMATAKFVLAGPS